MIKIYTLAIALMFSAIVFSSLEEKLTEINDTLAVIENDKEKFEQTLEFDSDAPYQVVFARTKEKLKDGKTESESWAFNLALVDFKNVTIKTSKKKLSVELRTAAGKFFKTLEDGEAKGFTNKIEILADEIDAARDLKSLLEETIVLARDKWEEALSIPEQREENVAWLSERIITVSEKGKSKTQTLEPHPKYKDYLIYDYKDEKDHLIASFSLSDIDIKSAKVSSGRETVDLTLKTVKKNKTIQEKDGDRDLSFSNEISFIFADPSVAMSFITALEQLQTSTESIQKERLESYKDCEDCIADLSLLLEDYGLEKTSPKVNGDCKALIQFLDGKKEKTLNLQWGDIDPSSIKTKYNSDNVQVSFATFKKEKFLTEESEKGKKFLNSFDFKVTDVEAGNEITSLISSISESCEVSTEIEDIEWINGVLNDDGPIEKHVQSILLDDGKECSVSYTDESEDGKKSKNYVFNLYDINPSSLGIKISGSKLMLEMKSNKSEKIIKVTDHKDKSEYTNKVVLYFPGIDELRTGNATMQKLIQQCQK